MKKKLLLLSICFFMMSLSGQVITVDDTQTAQQLIEDVLIKKNPCVKASNFHASGDTFTLGKKSYGYFSKGSSSFPFAEGIVLSNSNVKDAIGPPIRADFENEDSDEWLGDADLEATLAPALRSKNATVLEFDIVASGNFFSFNYIFASQEYYDDYSCDFSDGFAFLIKEVGSSDPYKNLAVIPGTNTPVAANTIHDKNTTCDEKNVAYYNGENDGTAPINFIGQTKVLTAQTSVVQNKKYHIKLVISDDLDLILNSAVFIEAGSFKAEIDLGGEKTINKLCEIEPYTINPNLGLTDSYKWFLDDVLLPAVTTPSLTVYESGKYTVKAIPFGSTCEITGELKLTFVDPPIISIPLIQCDDDSDGKTFFDLNKVEEIMRRTNANIIGMNYYETLDGAKNPLTNTRITSDFYQNKVKNDVVYARTNDKNFCVRIVKINLLISSTSLTPLDISICNEDNKRSGLYQFDLDKEITPNILKNLPSGLIVDYYLSSKEAVFEDNKLMNNFKNTTPNQQVIYARIANASDCYAIIPVTLKVNSFYFSDFENQDVIKCGNNTVELKVISGLSNYLWTTGENTNKITINQPGNYSVTASDVNNCSKTKKFTVQSSEVATITKAIVTYFPVEENEIQIQYTGTGEYEFSLDGYYYQGNPLKNVMPGEYKVVARDKNGCGLSTPFDVWIIDFPKFFTPNADGYNDYWKIKFATNESNLTIHIFDRYGKLLQEINNQSQGWDGTYRGQPMPADDYWFTVVRANGKLYKEHFTLKR